MDINKHLRVLHNIQQENHLGIEVLNMYQSLYDYHKLEYGSNRHLQGDLYTTKMNERYNYCLNTISNHINDMLWKKEKYEVRRT